MVMYSRVASCCHPQMLLTHVDNPITAKIIHHYSSSCQATPGAHRCAVPRRCPPEALAGAGGVTLHGYLGTASPTQEIQVLESRLSLSIWESNCPSLCCSLLQGLGVGGRQWGAALP